MEYHDPVVSTLPGSSPSPRRLPASSDPIAAYENSVASQLSQIILSEEQGEVFSSSKVLCETIKDFVAKVGMAFAQDERDHENMTRKVRSWVLGSRS